MNIYIETYGCSANQAESEIMAGLLVRSGYSIVDNIENADLIIVNTCYVKFPTEQKVLFRIRKIQKQFPDKKLVIGGCMPAGAYDRIKKIAPNASLISTHQIKKISKLVQKTLRGEKVEITKGKEDIKLCLPRIRKSPVVNIVPIASGCNGDCTYCATKLAKGELFSYPKNRILDEIKESVKAGCKEIWLTAQDTGAYGLDKGKLRLPELLKGISKISGKFFVRVGMMNPHNIKNIVPELISAFNSKKIYKFLHLPIQSGDDQILKKMNRMYTSKEFEEIVSAFNDAFRFQLWTDIIVGYPGETDEQFRNSLELLKKLEPDYVNVSRYGMRPDTYAATLKPLPSEILKERSRKASNLVSNFALKKNKEWLDWRGDILISEKGTKPGQWVGRNYAYKNIIINKRGNLLGKIIKVKILDALPSGLMGWPIK